MTTFLNEFLDHITMLLQTCNEPIILGDINIPWNKSNHIDTVSMTEILDLFGLTQLVNFQTHKLSNAIDWIICKDPTRIENLTKHNFISDHCIIAWEHLTTVATSEWVTYIYRDLSKVNINTFRADLIQSLEKLKHYNNLRNVYEGHMSAIKSTLDIHAPLNGRKLARKSQYPWFDPDVHKTKHQRRIAEKHWIRTQKDSDRKHYTHVNTCFKRCIFKSN